MKLWLTPRMRRYRLNILNAWRGRARDCRDRIQREREAFLVQAAYLERFGVHDFNVAAALQRYPCQGETRE